LDGTSEKKEQVYCYGIVYRSLNRSLEERERNGALNVDLYDVMA